MAKKNYKKAAVASLEGTIWMEDEVLVPIGRPKKRILIRSGDKVTPTPEKGRKPVDSSIMEQYIDRDGSYHAGKSEEHKKALMNNILATKKQLRKHIQTKWVAVDMNTKMRVDSNNPLYIADSIINAMMQKQKVQLKTIRNYSC